MKITDYDWVEVNKIKITNPSNLGNSWEVILYNKNGNFRLATMYPDKTFLIFQKDRGECSTLKEIICDGYTHVFRISPPEDGKIK